MKKTISLIFLILLFTFNSASAQVVIGDRTPQWIVDGKHASFSGVFKFGHNDQIDTGTDPEDIWMTGLNWPVFADDSTIAVVSTSTADDTSGTGALTLTIFGVDSSYVRISETISLGGTDAVTLVNAYRVIYRVIVATAGSGLTNAGVITFTSPGSITVLTIKIGDGQSHIAVYPIAADEDAFIYCWGISSLTAAADLFAELLVLNVDGNVWNVKDIIHSRAAATSNPHRGLEMFPIKISGKAVIRIRATTDTDASNVTGHFTVHHKVVR